MTDELTLPVFPLPNVTLFPRTLLPLHIFESRYQSLVADLLAKPEENRLIIITHLENQSKPRGKNSFSSIGTVGRMVHVDPLDDGRSNIVIYGQFTVDMEEIVPSPKPYRMARIHNIREEYWENPLQDHSSDQAKLMSSIQRFMDRTKSRIENIESVELDDLINGLAHSLNINSDLKQDLLELQALNDRLDKLVEIIDRIGYYTDYVPDEKQYKDIN